MSITKQKIKHLEKSVEKLRGEKNHCIIKKYAEETYFYEGKIYTDLVDVKKDIDFHPGDVLVIAQDYGQSAFKGKKLLK